MSDLVHRADELQRRHRLLGVPLGVVYKFFDDQGNYLAATVTYYAFVAIFPILLIASSVLGFLLQGNTQLQEQVLSSALSQFPIVGTQLGEPGGVQGSASAVVIGVVAALYGVLGLGQAAQNTVNVVWAVPRNSRMNPLLSRLSSLGLLGLAGITVLVVTALTSLSSHLDVFGSDLNRGVEVLATLAGVAVNAVVLSEMMRLATARRESFWTMLPGGVAIALMWWLLQWGGGAYVRHVITRASDMNGVFAIVLGLVALLYVAAVMAVIGVEINVVLARRLFPRALLTPFTDAVDLTDADRRAYAAYAKAQRHKGFERVRVTFGRPPSQAAVDRERERGRATAHGASPDELLDRSTEDQRVEELAEGDSGDRPGEGPTA